MADENKDENKSSEELETDQRNSERAKISLPESIILIMLSLSADTLEAFSLWASVAIDIGGIAWIIWLMAFVFGLFVSLIIITWAFLRNVHGGLIIKRLLLWFTADILTAGILPIRTLALIIAIWLNNRLESENLKKTLTLLSKIK